MLFECFTFNKQKLLAVIEMLLVGHFSSKLRGFYPSEFPVLENLRRAMLESQGPSSGPFISICYNPTKVGYFSPLEPVARCSCDYLSDPAPPNFSGALRKWHSSIPGSIPSKSLRCLCFWSRDASSCCQQRAQTLFIGMQLASEIQRCNQVSITLGHHLAVAPKIRSGS